MSSSPDDGYAEMGEVCAVVRVYCDETFKRMARRIVAQMQRVRASGIYGDDYRHKTLWDEYCHEVQEGPYEPIETAWDQTMRGFIDALVEELPRHEATILTIGAVWELEQDESLLGSVCADSISEQLKCVLDGVASARDMSRFDPTGSE